MKRHRQISHDSLDLETKALKGASRKNAISFLTLNSSAKNRNIREYTKSLAVEITI